MNIETWQEALYGVIGWLPDKTFSSRFAKQYSITKLQYALSVIAEDCILNSNIKTPYTRSQLICKPQENILQILRDIQADPLIIDWYEKSCQPYSIPEEELIRIEHAVVDYLSDRKPESSATCIVKARKRQ